MRYLGKEFLAFLLPFFFGNGKAAVMNRRERAETKKEERVNTTF